MNKSKQFLIKPACIIFLLFVIFTFHLAGDVPVDPELTQGETWDYIIITKTPFVDDFQTLAEYRHKQGLKTAIFTTAGIYDAYSDVTDGSLPQVSEFPKRIREFLKDMYTDHGLEYVLIGGDTEKVPTRHTYGWIGYDNIAKIDINGSIPTDLYYSAGFNTGDPDYYDLTWNNQGPYWCPIMENYFTGYEPPPNNTPYDSTYYFKIHLKVGRLCVGTASEISDYTNKVMEYESADEYSHLEKGTFLAAEQAGVTGIEKYVVETEYDSSGVVSEWNPNISSTMTIERIYTDGSFVIDDTLPTPTPAQQIYYAVPSPVPTNYEVLGNSCSKTNINSALNAGTNICTWGGHGHATGFGGVDFINTDAYALDSGGKYGGLFFTGTCETAAFDAGANYIKNDYIWNEECLGVSFLKSVDGGFTNYVGASRTILADMTPLLQSMLKNLFNIGTYNEFTPGFYTAGNLYMIGKQIMIDEYKDYLDIPVGDYGYAIRSGIMSVALLGDPAVSIYTKEPNTLTVTHPSQISHGSPTTVYVTVKYYYYPVYNVQVCLYKEDEIYEVKNTNLWGNVFFTGIEADTTGTLYVTATIHNYKRYSGTIIVN
jgi:hypothetical protein